MESIRIQTGIPYDALVGRGLLDQAGSLARNAVRGNGMLILADENVAPLYLERAGTAFEQAGFRTGTFVFPAGEEAKRLSTVEAILTEADCRKIIETAPEPGAAPRPRRFKKRS